MPKPSFAEAIAPEPMPVQPRVNLSFADAIAPVETKSAETVPVPVAPKTQRGGISFASAIAPEPEPTVPAPTPAIPRPGQHPAQAALERKVAAQRAELEGTTPARSFSETISGLKREQPAAPMPMAKQPQGALGRTVGAGIESGLEAAAYLNPITQLPMLASKVLPTFGLPTIKALVNAGKKTVIDSVAGLFNLAGGTSTFNNAVTRFARDIGSVSDDIREKESQEIRSMLANDQAVRAIVNKVATAGAEVGANLSLMQAGVGALGRFAGIKSLIPVAGEGWAAKAARAGIFGATAALKMEGSVTDRLKAAAISTLYMMTPILSGKAPTNATAMLADMGLNMGISLGLGKYQAAVRAGIEQAKEDGNPGKWLQYSVVNLLPDVGSDIGFSLMTRSNKAMEEAARRGTPTPEEVQKIVREQAVTQTQETINAKAVRGDAGQVYSAGDVTKAGQVEGGRDLRGQGQEPAQGGEGAPARAVVPEGVAVKAPGTGEHLQRTATRSLEQETQFAEEGKGALESGEAIAKNFEQNRAVADARAMSEVSVRAIYENRAADAPERAVAGIVLAEKLKARGDTEGSQRVFDSVTDDFTTAAQTLRVAAEIKGSTPEGLVDLAMSYMKKALGARGIALVTTPKEKAFAMRDKKPMRVLPEGDRKILDGLAAKDMEARGRLRTEETKYRTDPTPQNLAMVKQAEDAAQKAHRAFIDKTQRYLPQSVWSTLFGAEQAHLMSPITHGINMSSNISNNPVRFVEETVAATADAIDSWIRGRPRQVPFPWLGAWQRVLALPETWRQVKSILKTGRELSLDTENDFRRAWRPLQSLVQAATGKGLLIDPKTGKASWSDRGRSALEALFGPTAELMQFRLLAVEDALSRLPRSRQYRYQEGWLLGKRGVELEKFVNAPLEGIKTPEGKAESEAVKRASYRAREHVYQAGAYDAVVKLFSGLKSTRLGPAVDFAVRNTTGSLFMKTIANWGWHGLQIVRPEIGLAVSAAKAKMGDTAGAKRAMGSAVAGTILNGLGLALAQMGAVSPDRDKDKRIRAGQYEIQPPSRINLSMIRRIMLGQQGKDEAEWRKGDFSIPLFVLGWGGWAFNIQANALQRMRNQAQKEGERFNPRDRGFLGTALQSYPSQWAVTGSSLKMLGMVKGYSVLMGAILEGEFQRWTTNMIDVLSAIPSPNVLRNVARSQSEFMHTMIDRELGPTALNILSTRNPFNFIEAWEKLPVNRDMWGRPVKGTPEGRDPIAWHLLDFTKGMRTNYDEATKTAWDSYVLTNDPNYFPMPPSRTLSMGGVDVKLDSKLHDQFVAKVGEKRLTILKNRLADKSRPFDQIGLEAKANILKEIYKDGRDSAEDEFIGEHRAELTRLREVAKAKQAERTLIKEMGGPSAARNRAVEQGASAGKRYSLEFPTEEERRKMAEKSAGATERTTVAGVPVDVQDVPPRPGPVPGSVQAGSFDPTTGKVIVNKRVNGGGALGEELGHADEFRAETPRAILGRQYSAEGMDLEKQEQLAIQARQANPTPRYPVNQSLALLDQPVSIRTTSQSLGEHAVGPIAGVYNPATQQISLRRGVVGKGTLEEEAQHRLQTNPVDSALPLVERYGNPRKISEAMKSGLSETAIKRGQALDEYFSNPAEINPRLSAIRLAAGEQDPARALISVGFVPPGASAGETVPSFDAMRRLQRNAESFRDYFNGLDDADKQRLWDYMVEQMPLLVQTGAKLRAIG